MENFLVRHNRKIIIRFHKKKYKWHQLWLEIDLSTLLCLLLLYSWFNHSISIILQTQINQQSTSLINKLFIYYTFSWLCIYEQVIMCSLTFPLEMISGQPLCSTVMFPILAARSSTILGSGDTQGDTSLWSTAFTSLENSMALGVITALYQRLLIQGTIARKTYNVLSPNNSLANRQGNTYIERLFQNTQKNFLFLEKFNWASPRQIPILIISALYNHAADWG